MFRVPPNVSIQAGFTVLEVVVATVILGSILVVVVPASKRAIDHQHQMQLRRSALLEVANTLERLLADRDSWPHIGDEREMPLRPEFAARLDQPRLLVRSALVDERDYAVRRLDAEIDWQLPTGHRSTPIRLSGFAIESERDSGGGNAL